MQGYAQHLYLDLGGLAYLATVIDCATKKIVGWAVGDNYKTPLITEPIPDDSPEP